MKRGDEEITWQNLGETTRITFGKKMGSKNGRKEEGFNKGKASMEAKPIIIIIIEGLKKTMYKKGN